MRNALTTLRLTLLVFLGLAALFLLGSVMVFLLTASPSQLHRLRDDPLGSIKRSFARHGKVTVERIHIENPPDADAVADSGQRYTVKEGEDLYVVAIRFGVSPSHLRILNNLSAADVKPGTVLKIPVGTVWQSLPQAEEDDTTADPAAGASGVDPTGQTYTVRAGEDLYSVAIRTGVSPSDLRKWNNLKSSALTPGMVLKISNVEK